MSRADHRRAPSGPRVVSREPELLALDQLLLEGGPVTCLVLVGEAGIGKTTVWEAGLEAARAKGYLVLPARGSQAEVGLPFAAMSDMLDPVDRDVLLALPAPQLHAVEVALRRREPGGVAPDAFAIAAGFLSALRILADRGQLLIAIDDIQWLDHASANALLFAARRLPEDGVRFLITRRAGRESDLERVLQPGGVEHLNLAPLSFGATARLLSQRYGNALTRRLIRQIHQASQGNPLFALELGRLLVTKGLPESTTDLPLPGIVDDIFGARVRQLPGGLRRALLAVALSAEVSWTELAEVVDPLALEDAVSLELLVIDRGRIRPSHPMLAAAVRGLATPRERKDLHRDLASAVLDPTLRARHLAIATVDPDASLARTVADAAELTASRGAVEDAAELGVHALRLTPPEAPERADRLLALGGYHLRSDQMSSVTDLLTRGMRELAPGRPRALAHLLLGQAADFAGDVAHTDSALLEAPDDPEVRALALAKKSRLLTDYGVERVDEAEDLAVAAGAAAEQAGSEAQKSARSALLRAQIYRGHRIDLTPAEVADFPGGGHPDTRLDRTLATWLMFRGEVDEARNLLERVVSTADESGDVQHSRLAQELLCEVELRAGNARQARRLLDDMDHDLPWMPMVQARLHSVLGALTGESAETARWAAMVLESGSGVVKGRDRLEAVRAVGLSALFEQDPARAVEMLDAVWQHTVREHVDNPGVLPVAADLVEAHLFSSDTESAEDVTQRLELLATEQSHPSGLATWRRCAAAVQLADGYVDEAAHAMRDAAEAYGNLGLNFDRARTLLFLGGVQRTSLRRAEARQSLYEAATQFERCGCTGWADRARADLARVSGRRSLSDGPLTPSERRVVDMAVDGLSNKEIASRLFVSVNTVEVHLSHAYTKLGVRSRTQLARALNTPVE